LTKEFVPEKLLHSTDEFVPDTLLHPVAESKTHNNIIAGAEQQGDDDKDYKEAYLGDHLRFKMKREGKRFWAGDNISDYLNEGDVERLIDEATPAFEQVLDRLLIDRDDDPNSKGTARRLAKMYFNEVMVVSYEVCVLIITSLYLGLPTSVSLPLINLLVSASIPE